jgi:hypothetical protein
VQISPLLAEILKGATRSSRCKVVGEVADATGLLGHVARRRADVVLVGLETDVSEGAVETALRARPGLSIFGLEHNGRRLFAYELRMNRAPLGELSLRELVDLMGSARHPHTVGDPPRRRSRHSPDA